MKLKGFTKLSIQIAVLSVSMILLSFFTDTDIWLKYFNEPKEAGFCAKGGHYADYEFHYHTNYRGMVYIFTGIAFFIISVFKIIISHKEEDFTNK